MSLCNYEIGLCLTMPFCCHDRPLTHTDHSDLEFTVWTPYCEATYNVYLVGAYCDHPHQVLLPSKIIHRPLASSECLGDTQR